MRGRFRSTPGKEVLANSLLTNVRTGSLLTLYYPNADEAQEITINDKDIYEVVTFSHSDHMDSTLWTLKFLRKFKNGNRR